jgi:flagellar motor switch protein FliN
MNEEIRNEINKDTEAAGGDGENGAGEDVHTPRAIGEEELQDVGEAIEHLRIEDIRKVKLPITADLGRCYLNVREVLELKPGSVLAMDKLAGEMADLYVGGIPLARGEVVVLGDTLHVRLAEIMGLDEDEGLQFEEE